MSVPCFVPADILLPAANISLDPWACIAVDQFTSQPEYWQRAEELAAGKPSTLHIVLPEAYLGTPQEEERMQTIRRTMQEYRKSVLTRRVHGFVYVERTQMDGTIRQGLVGAVDLEAYDYNPGSKPAIRPSEKTVVERIPPRLKVRRGAILETPHVMMLADDEKKTLIEPIGDHKDSLPLLYDGELMLGGGHLRGWAVEDPALIDRINAALADLADEKKFAARWPRAAGEPPMVLAVGDGNHSLATAKAYWEELKKGLTPEQQQDHPARWRLAEVCNVHSPARSKCAGAKNMRFIGFIKGYWASTGTVQPLVSGSLPHWIPVRVSYSFWVSSPILPPLIWAVLPSQSSSLTGETTAAVPVPKTSSSLPSSAAFMMSAMATRSSCTL